MRRREILAGAATLPALLAQQANWKPLTLNANQNETVITLTDLLIPATDTPGAKAANVNRYIDLLLTDGPAQQRTTFLAGLAKLDTFTQQSHGKPFRSCTAVQQTAILKRGFDGTAPADIAEFLGAAGQRRDDSTQAGAHPVQQHCRAEGSTCAHYGDGSDDQLAEQG